MLMRLIWHSHEALRRLQHSKLHVATSPFLSQHHCMSHPRPMVSLSALKHLYKKL